MPEGKPPKPASLIGREETGRWGRTAHVQPAFVSSAETQIPIMNFQDPEYLINEPWWVTISGCITLAALIAFALIAS